MVVLMNDTTHRVALRKQLLDNGYKPLPLLDKGIRIKGWSTAEIDADWLAQFNRSAKYRNTGIRCDDLAAFDIDVLDEDLADEIEAYIEDRIGPTDLCRVGAWPKRLLLYRCVDGAPHSLRTGKYAGHMVELLAGNGRQFAAFGRHPSGRDYTWLEGSSPLDYPLHTLPVVTFDRAKALLAELEKLFSDRGLKRDAPGGSITGAGSSVHDIDDDFEFREVDGTVHVWSELRAELDTKGIWGNVRREDGEFGDSDAVHAFLAAGVGEPCIHDFARDTTHYESSGAGQLAAALPTPPASAGIFTCPNLKYLLDTFVLLGDKTVRFIDQPERVYALDGFRTLHAYMETPTPTRANPQKTTPTVGLWLKDQGTLRAHHAELRPDSDAVRLKEGDQIIFNTYNPPLHDVEGGDVSVALELVEHLIPDEVERALFLDWHALKLSRPDWRMHGLITVTEAFGTGRGTWAKILERLVGGAYFRTVNMKDIFGGGGQADYNEFLATSLVVYVPEALEEDGHRSHWQSRMLAYERVKSICEPGADVMHIKRKYGRNTHERVYTSLLVSSNHSDAMAIEAGDRRLIVLKNTDKPLVRAKRKLRERIHEWLQDERNIAALYRWFLDRAAAGVDYDPFDLPMETPAKFAMIDSGRSDIDHLWGEFADRAKGAIATLSQWRAFAFELIRTGEYDVPDHGAKLDRGLQAIMKKRGRRIESINETGIKVDGAKVRPWIVRDFERWETCEDNAEIRREINKNGAAGGKVLPLK